MKLFSKLIYFFITLGANNERRINRISKKNMAMIIFYYIQLIGYIFSQFEQKPLIYYESNYLGQIGQYSSIPFLLITIHYDPLTLIVYYGVFTLHCLIYICILYQISFKQKLKKNHIFNKFIKFYFQNFQWFFLTPFNECMIGVITCGPQSYLKQHTTINPQQCFQNISPHYIVISVVGIILVSISGFLANYAFRSFEFLQANLMRKFSLINFIVILLHQSLAITSFLKLMFNNYYIIIHTIYYAIMLCIFIDNCTQLTFGYSHETIFYQKCLFCSIYFGILITVWVFSIEDDGIIFLSFTLFIPLLITINQAYYDNLIDRQCTQFMKAQYLNLSELPLEHYVMLSQSEVDSKASIFQLLKYLKLHTLHCKDTNCPCYQSFQKFINTVHIINHLKLQTWIQYQLQKQINIAIKMNLDFYIFENLSLKFATYLQKYRSNQYLSFKSIQDVVYIFEKQNKQKNSAYFFYCLTQKIQKDNKEEIEKYNKTQQKLELNEYLTIQDINLFYFYQNKLLCLINDILQLQLQFWNKFKNNSFKDYQHIIQFQYQIQLSIKLFQSKFNKFQNMREVKNQINLLNLRIIFLKLLVCSDSLLQQNQIAIKIQELEKDQLFSQKMLLTFGKYLDGQAVSIISKLSSQLAGKLEIHNDSIKFFFNNSEELKEITQLLPIGISEIHQALISNFLFQGSTPLMYSKLDTFILNGQNFIEKVSMSLSLFISLKNGFQFIVITHLLKYKEELQNERGFILVDPQFNIFGLTQNIFEKFQQDSNIQLHPDMIYKKVSIFGIIPNLLDVLKEYYTNSQLQYVTTIQSEKICSKQQGSFYSIINQDTQMKYNYSKSITNKKLLKQLQTYQRFLYARRQLELRFQSPISFSINQRKLNLMILDQQYDYFYLQIEIEFENCIENALIQNITPQNDKPPQLKNINQKPHSVSMQSFAQEICSPIGSNNNLFHSKQINSPKIIQILESSSASSRRLYRDINDQMNDFQYQISNEKLPSSLIIFIGLKAFESIIFIVLTILISQFLNLEQTMQSQCLFQTDFNINFIQAYNQALQGITHFYFIKEFQNEIQDIYIEFNNTYIVIDQQDKLNIALQNFNEGIINIMEAQSFYEQMIEVSNNIQIQYIDDFSQFNSKIQTLQDQSTYIQMIISSLLNLQVAINNNLEQPNLQWLEISKSIIYLNFFDYCEQTKLKLIDCKEQNNSKNYFFSQSILFIFVGIYIMIFIQFLFSLYYLIQIRKSNKIIIDIFTQLDTNDIYQCIQLYGYRLKLLPTTDFIYTLQKFDELISEPQNIYDKIRIQNLGYDIKHKIDFNTNNEKIIINKNVSIIKEIFSHLLSFIIFLIFCISFHVHFTNITQDLSPIQDISLQAQQNRLDWLISVGRFELLLLKTFYLQYQQINESIILNENIIQDINLYKKLEISNVVIESDVINFNLIDFTELIYQIGNQSELISEDICISLGCNMTQSYQNKIYLDIFLCFFNIGIVQLHQIVNMLQEDAVQTIIEQNENQIESIKQYFSNQNYFIYIFWGQDLILFQIQELVNYFVNQINSLIIYQFNYIYFFVYFFGILGTLSVSILSYFLIKKQIRVFRLSKGLFKFIPLTIIFKKQIQKQLGVQLKRMKCDNTNQ